MLLAFTDKLTVTTKFDAECAALADSHYSRQSVGDRQFMPPGRTLVIRNNEGTILFGWNWQYEHKRADHEEGFCCCIFRNVSPVLSSLVIREAEEIAIDRWGRNRMFTYVDARKVRSSNPGFCFKVAGWEFKRRSRGGLHLLVKDAG